MATRFYLVATTTPDVSPAFDGGWDTTASMVRRTLDVTKAASTETVSGSTPGTSSSDAGAVQLLSRSIVGQTITGQLDFVTDSRESATDDNINTALTAVKVVSSDGGTVRGTLRAHATGGGTSELSATGLSGRTHLLNASASSVVAQDGDRILIELGFGHSGAVTGTTPQWSTRLGGNGTDHANTNGDTTGTVAWFEFAANFVFLTTGTAVASLGGLTATAAGTREVGGTANATLGALTADAAGVVTVLGVADATLGGLNAAAVATVTHLGEATAPLGGLTATALATVTHLGEAAALFALTAQASGTAEALGTLGAAQAVFTLTASAVGSVAGPVHPDRGVRLRGVRPRDALRGTPSDRRRR